MGTTGGEFPEVSPKGGSQQALSHVASRQHWCLGSDPTQVTFVPSTCGLGATQRTTGEDHANLR